MALLTVRLHLPCLLALALAGAASPTCADSRIFERDGFTLDLSLDAGLGVVATGDTNFGAGVVTKDGGLDRNVDDGEGYVLPRLKFGYTSGFGEFYGAIGVVGSATFAEPGDPGGFTPGAPHDVDVEDGYFGWRSGTLVPGGENVLDISGGRQQFHIGDGFLIWDGNNDVGGKGAYWLGPRYSFENSGIVRVNTKPVRADLFYLKSDNDQFDTELAGINLEYVDETLGTAAFGYYHLLDSTLATRDDVDIFDVRAQGHPIEALPDLFLAGEYVREVKDGGADVDADAWYLEADYTFSQLPWTPTVGYRYSHFSGDDSHTRRFEGFDALFYSDAFAETWRGWGTWTQGEITGEYLLFNSNENVHLVQLTVQPSETLSAGLLLFRFDLDEPASAGASSSHFADELNVHVDWSIGDHLSISALYGVAVPGAAAKEIFGRDELYQLGEASLTLTF